MILDDSVSGAVLDDVFTVYCWLIVVVLYLFVMLTTASC